MNSGFCKFQSVSHLFFCLSILAYSLFLPGYCSTEAAPERGDSVAPASKSGAADLVLIGGSVYTMDASRSWASAVAIKEGKILYVGKDGGIRSFIGPRTKVQELNGRMVLPGFHDSHVHLIDGGILQTKCVLDNAKSREEIFRTIKDYAATHPTEQWIIGSGWALPLFPNTSPTRQELDAVTGHKPAFFYAQDGHSAWANSAALALAKVDKKTRDPVGGRIERESDGTPSGTLREDACNLIQKIVPKDTDEQRVNGGELGVRLAHRFGITSIQDAHCDADILNTYLELQRRGKLSLNVIGALHTDPEKGVEQVHHLSRMREKFSQGRVIANMAKIFADGVIESHTASMMQPYVDKPNDRGMPNYSHEALSKLVSNLVLSGFRIHVHAIGDQAVHDALDAFESIYSADDDKRHEIAHLELIDPPDIQRFRKLGVIADCQPLWAYNDPYITEATLPRIGPERTARIYPFQSLYGAGATIACGSDWPVSSLNPLDAIQVAVTREGVDGNRTTPLSPTERMSLSDVLAGYTINGAFAATTEKQNGSIEPGKDADIIVLDKNLFSLDPHEIHNAKVVLTLFGGTEVFRDDSFPQQDVAMKGK